MKLKAENFTYQEEKILVHKRTANHKSYEMYKYKRKETRQPDERALDAKAERVECADHWNIHFNQLLTYHRQCRTFQKEITLSDQDYKVPLSSCSWRISKPHLWKNEGKS
uniref:Uncharacterized protein n=1 Tax=Romanomermis culicivorax TaxID=13658 RepID=A0A915IF58_ROMCU